MGDEEGDEEGDGVGRRRWEVGDGVWGLGYRKERVDGGGGREAGG